MYRFVFARYVKALDDITRPGQSRLRWNVARWRADRWESLADRVGRFYRASH